MNRVHIAGMTFVALLFLPWVSASASTIYNTTESYTENYIGVDLGGGVYSYLYAGHDVTSSGYSSPPATYTETYIYTPDGESDIGTQVTPAGLIYYAATDTATGPAPYDYTTTGVITGGTGIYAGAAGVYSTQYNVFSGGFNGIDPVPTAPEGSTIIDFGHDVGVAVNTFSVAAVPLPARFELLAGALMAIGMIGRRRPPKIGRDA